ncbi:hypothetical protein EDB83DRAFT_2376830 [Lactarius deliciosus]|nr:hypothetical protein EDB83DRAFT_2376830 [Lactarius deliciosus]
MNGNGSSPQCITGVINWVHGTFTYNSDGSMTMYSFGNGFQQIPIFRGLQFLGELQRHGAIPAVANFRRSNQWALAPYVSVCPSLPHRLHRLTSRNAQPTTHHPLTGGRLRVSPQ